MISHPSTVEAVNPEGTNCDKRSGGGVGLTMSTTITIDADHVYRDWTGAVWLGVTEILTAVLGDQWAGKTGQYHLDRWRSVHALFALLGNGERLEDYDVAPGLLPYAEQWRALRDVVQPGFVATEAIVYHASMRYAGTLDAVAYIGGRLCVLDYKASPTPRDKWQMAAYAMAWESMGGDKIAGLVSVQITPESWRMGEVVTGSKYAAAKREWMAIRTVYGLLEQSKGR
jgi:hypothetical protein